MKLAFGSDHAGFVLRRALAELARSMGHIVVEGGAPSEDPYDYPDAADQTVPMILSGECELGVLICGSGIGISIRANRHPGIRAAVCCTPEMARIARLHNHANVLCLGARFVAEVEARAILDAFLAGSEDSDERHVRRIGKLDGCLGV